MSAMLPSDSITVPSIGPKTSPLGQVQRNVRAVLHKLSDGFRVIVAIMFWELRAYFRRPTAYVMLLATTLVAGWNFSLLVTLLSRGRVVPLRAADDPLAQFLGPNVFLVLSMMLVIPIVTMGLVADERRRGLWEMLLTAPIQPLQAILGKFLAAWGVIVINILPWLYYLLVLRHLGSESQRLWGFVPWFAGTGLEFDLGRVVGGLIGLATVTLTLAAIGLLCSTLCRAPFAAAAATSGAMGVLLVLSLLPRALEYWQLGDKWISLSAKLACWEHLAEFSRGAVDPRIVCGHVSFTVFLLWLATQSSNWRD